MLTGRFFDVGHIAGGYLYHLPQMRASRSAVCYRLTRCNSTIEPILPCSLPLFQVAAVQLTNVRWC